MDVFLPILLLLAVGCIWALKAPVGHPDTPSADDLALRQRQIDAANHSEVL